MQAVFRPVTLNIRLLCGHQVSRQPGFVTVRLMVITAQNTRELWHCLEGLSIEPFDPGSAANWIKHYPGGLKFAE
ncbi:hypothetical protein [Dickeya dianthicola]|uniref:hypothetical protein n=1 Tax=Dickeya dianthicola TaxID=204039 RepID=UPI0018680D35|nr:hypothetical protein [Dickeya dianthicola]QOL12748.1 hypothetical protein HGI48_11615 [Dickeya dianthicola]